MARADSHENAPARASRWITAAAPLSCSKHNNDNARYGSVMWRRTCQSCGGIWRGGGRRKKNGSCYRVVRPVRPCAVRRPKRGSERATAARASCDANQPVGCLVSVCPRGRVATSPELPTKTEKEAPRLDTSSWNEHGLHEPSAALLCVVAHGAGRSRGVALRRQAARTLIRTIRTMCSATAVVHRAYIPTARRVHRRPFT